MIFFNDTGYIYSIRVKTKNKTGFIKRCLSNNLKNKRVRKER
jgi:hypothetical protein